MLLKSYLTLMIFFWSVAGLSEETGKRAELIDSYVKSHSDNPGIYQSTPIYHLVPSFNTITYALGVTSSDYKIIPKDPVFYESDELSVKGLKIEPHIAVSLKNISLGFSALRDTEVGEYKYVQSYSGSGYYQGQKSTLATSGVGLNAAIVPFPRLHRQLKLAFILNGKSLSVKHSISPLQSSNHEIEIQDEDMKILNYNFYRYSAGVNLNWHFFKQFSIVPWADYTKTDFDGARTQIVSSTTMAEGLADMVEKDWQLYFLSQPNLRYGLDFAADLFGFEVRLGGLLGSFASLNKSELFIKDSSLVLNVSFEQKGN
ncbi:MAG: hypothetical protein WCI18_11210 [Pseudomonadota bacterium]